MEQIHKNPNSCKGCPLLHSSGGWCHQYIPGRYFNCEKPGEAMLLVLAEAPALSEKREGRPLAPSGQAGRRFHHQLLVAGLSQTPRYLANVVMCTNLEPWTGRIKWKTRNPPDEAIACCAPKWQRLIDIIQPKVILLLGKTAMKAFGFHFGKKGDRKETIYDVASVGKPVTGTGWAPFVVATFHPSGLRAKTEEDRMKRVQHFQTSFTVVARLLEGA